MSAYRNRPKFPLDHEPTAVTYAREQAGLTKTQLANACGVSLSLISEIEGETRNATPAMLNKLAVILNCPRVVLERKQRGRAGHVEVDAIATDSTDLDERHVRVAQYLTALQLRLRAAGVQAVYELPEEWPPQVSVTMPSVSTHEDIIYVASRFTKERNLEWWFQWDWGEWVCRVDHLDKAVMRITERLRRP
jgi:transcriptional regulator with XRE-family HTH domain